MQLRRGFTKVIAFFVAMFIFSGVGFGDDLKKANDLVKKGKFEEALQLYQKAIDSKPKSDEARRAKVAMAQVYYENLKNSDKAIELYQSVVSEFPKTDDANQAQYRLGVHYYKVDDYAKAKDAFLKLINEATLSEEAGNAQLLIAKIYEKEGNYERAVFNYNGYAKLHPKSEKAVEALMLSASISVEKLDKKDDAIGVYQDVIKTYGDNPKSQKEVEEAKQKLSDLGGRVPEKSAEMATPQARRAARLEAKRERDVPRGQRGKEISRAMGTEAQATLQPSSFGHDADQLIREMAIPPDPQGTLYDAMAMIGNMYFQEDDYAKAGTLYERAIHLGSKSPEVYKSLAICFKKVGLEGKARETYQKAIKADPGMMDGLISSGEAQYSLGEYQQSLDTYNSLLGLSPGKDSRIYFNISLIYRKQYQEKQRQLKNQISDSSKQELGDLAAKEVEALERAIALKPGDTDALQNLAEALAYRRGDSKRAEIFDDAARGKTNNFKVQKTLADICYKYGAYYQARTRYQAALRNAQNPNPQNPSEKATPDDIAYVSAMAAVSAAKDKKIADGKAELNKLIQENPNSDLAYYGLGEIAILENNSEAAIENFKKAIALKADQTQANLALGNLYLNTGKKEEAVKLWEAYLAKNPNDEIVKGKLEEAK